MSSSKQGNITTSNELSGKESWAALLKDLFSASLGIPENWAQETSAEWSSDQQSLIVTVPSSTDDDWINRRLLPIASILFQEKHKEKRLVIRKKGEGKTNELLVKVHKDAYDHVVRPRKMIPVPFYLIHHWLPVLGASPFWVVIAMIQQSFVNTVNRKKESSVQKRISTRELSYWAPLAFRQISRYLNKDGFPSWFYKKENEGYQDVPPEYTVWSQLPIAPHHLAWIDHFISDAKKTESAVSLLESLLDKTGDIRRIKFGDIDIPGAYSSQRISLLDLITGHYPGNQDQIVYDLVTQLENQVVRPNLFISIPHYFFEKYGGVLNPNEAALIWYLRSLYKEDDSDSFSYSGYSQLGQSLGCSYKTVERMIESCALPEDEPVSSSWDSSFIDDHVVRNWLSIQYLSHNNKGAADKYSIGVRATEPIHQDDKDLYLQMVEDLLSLSQKPEDGGNSQPRQNDTPDEDDSSSQPRQNDTPDGGGPSSQPRQNDTPGNGSGFSQPRQKGTHPRQKDTRVGQDDTPLGHNGSPNLDKQTHLKSSLNGSLIVSLNDSVIPPLPSTDNQSSQYVDSQVVGVGEINLDKLLGFGSYKHNEKKKLADIIINNQALFLSWIIRNHITAAKFPVRLAVKNVQEGNETEDHYLEIANLGWGISVELVRVSEHITDDGRGNLRLLFYEDDEYSEHGYLTEIFRELSNSAKRVIKDLKETDFIQLVENVLANEDKGN